MATRLGISTLTAYVEFTIPNQYYTTVGVSYFYAGKQRFWTYRSAIENVYLALPIAPFSVIEACSIKFHIDEITGALITVAISFANSILVVLVQAVHNYIHR